jgi:hypothetical protein
VPLPSVVALVVPLVVPLSTAAGMLVSGPADTMSWSPSAGADATVPDSSEPPRGAQPLSS